MQARKASRLAIVLATLLISTTAHADPKDDARRHFAEGLAAAQGGSYDLALQHFLAAQASYPHPATVYNIAKAYSDLNDPENALIYWRQFRELAPDRRADTDTIIAALEGRLAPTTPVAAAPAPVGTVTTVVVAGASEAEINRLRQLAQELEALSAQLAQNTADQIAAATSSPGAVEAAPVGPPPEVPPTVAIPESAFISDAYEKVVVSASRVGQEPLDSPSTVTILSADDIRTSAGFLIPDLLRRVVGVDEMNLSATQTDVSIRGLNRELSNKVLVLIDGRSSYVDIIGSTLWGSLPITLEEIERIEVIRGPGSAVYGGNAVTGVINIITKTPGEDPEHLVRLDSGNAGLARATAMSNGRQGSTAYRISAAYTQHGRWTKDTEIAPGIPAVPLIENQDLAQKTMQANVRVDRPFGDKGLVSVSGGMNDGSYEYYNIGALGGYGMDATSWYARGDVSWDPVHLRVFWNALDGLTGPWLEPLGSNHPLTSPIRNDIVDTEIETPLAFETGPIDHTLNLGLGWRHKRFQFGYLDGGFETPYTEEHFAFFLNEAAKIESVTIVGSMRIDRHPQIPDLTKTISPRGSLIWRAFDKTAFRATAGTSFRSPTPIENYMRFDLGSSSANGAYIEDFGNLNLSPERIMTLELGVHDESSFYHMADVALFYNRVTDLIGLEPVVLGPNFLDPASNGFEVGETGWANLDPVYTAFGAEFDAEVYPTDGMDVFVNLALNRINETTDGQTLQDQSTSFAKFNVGATWRTPIRTDLTAAVHYVGPQVWRLREFAPTGGILLNEAPVAARVLAEARVAVRPLPKDDVELALNAWNFTALFRDEADLAAAGTALAASKAAGLATAVPGDGVADYATVPTYQEHPKGQPLGGRLYGSVTWRF